MMVQPKKNLQSIQLARGVACMLVILFHITATYLLTYGTTFLGDAFRSGGAGVDIFFVLSGFIITYTNKKYVAQPGAVGHFLLKRGVRIFPIYWIVITFYLALQLLFPAFYRVHYDLSLSNLLSTYLLLPDHIMVNGVSWTLTNELSFYLLFTIALLVPQRKWALWSLIGYSIFLAVLAAFNIYDVPGHKFLSVFIFPMTVEFLSGVLIALMATKFSKVNSLFSLLAGIVLLMAGALFHTLGYKLFQGDYDRVVLFGVPAFLIILGLVNYEMRSDVTIPRIFLAIGDASYSIYLIHLPIVAAFFKILPKFGIRNQAALTIICLLLFVILVIAGLAFYRLIEKPLIEKLSTFTTKKQPAPIPSSPQQL